MQLANLAYNRNFLDPDFPRRYKADWVILCYIYNPSPSDQRYVQRTRRPTNHYRQYDEKRHFVSGAWSCAAKACGAQIVTVIHAGDSEIGPKHLGDDYWEVKTESYDTFQRRTTMFANDYVLPACP